MEKDVASGADLAAAPAAVIDAEGLSAASLQSRSSTGGRDWFNLLATLGLLASLALVLLGIVDVRRGLLLPLPEYYRVGAPTAVLHFAPHQLLLLGLGAAGTWLFYRRLAAAERRLGRGRLKALANVVGVAVLLLLIGDLFLYRGVAAARIASAEAIGLGNTIPAAPFPQWAQPFRDGLNYMAQIWHATFLAILLGALFLTLLGAVPKTWLAATGFRGHVMGATLAAPLPFCACCSAPLGTALYRRGASLGAALAFIVSAPMLNVTTVLLAVLLLPWDFAALRIFGGVVVGVFVTYSVSTLAGLWRDPELATPRARNPLVRLLSAVVGPYSRLFNPERFLPACAADSPTRLLSAWLATAWALARVIVPVVLVGAVATVAIVSAFPAPDNNLLGVVVAAFFGTLLMVPTWAEVAVAGPLIKEGLTGPAAALLLTLPAVSVPCLAVIAGAVPQLRVVWMLGLAVFATGVLAGVVFLAI